MQKVCIHAYIVLPIVLNLEFLSASGGKFALIGGKRRLSGGWANHSRPVWAEHCTCTRM